MIDKYIQEALNSPRGSGRTTRMLFAVMEYLLKNPEYTAIIVCHDDSACTTMENNVRNIMSRQLADRVRYDHQLHCYNLVGGGNATYVFIDHHCYFEIIEEERVKLNKLLELYKQYD